MDKICVCSRCSYTINEHLKKCPLCGEKMLKVKGEKRQLNQFLPPKLEGGQDIALVYYCKKCNAFEQTKICLLNNTPNSLALKYYDRFVMLEKIEHLREVFTLDEVLKIIESLRLDDLDLIYYSYKNAYQYFYQKDKNKGGLMFLLSVLIPYLTLLVADYFQDEKTLIVTYFALALGVGFFLIFFILGFTYLFNASSIEYKNLTKKIAIIATFVAFLYVLVMIVLNPRFVLALRYALISLILGVIIYFIDNLGRKK